MGVWGYRINECDAFCEACELFEKLRSENTEVNNIQDRIISHFPIEPDHYIAQLAIIFCRWKHDELDKEAIDSLKEIVLSGIDDHYWAMSGAPYELRKLRNAELMRFAEMIQTTKSKCIPPKNQKVFPAKKGGVFYYRSCNNTIGAIVLDIINGFYLIAISAPISKAPSLDEILAADLYTLAWFSEQELLAANRIHYCSDIATGDYNGRAGLKLFANGAIHLTNYGDKKTWMQKRRNYCLKNASVKYVCNPTNVPKTS